MDHSSEPMTTCTQCIGSMFQAAQEVVTVAMAAVMVAPEARAAMAAAARWVAFLAEAILAEEATGAELTVETTVATDPEAEARVAAVLLVATAGETVVPGMTVVAEEKGKQGVVAAQGPAAAAAALVEEAMVVDSEAAVQAREGMMEVAKGTGRKVGGDSVEGEWVDRTVEAAMAEAVKEAVRGAARAAAASVKVVADSMGEEGTGADRASIEGPSVARGAEGTADLAAARAARAVAARTVVALAAAGTVVVMVEWAGLVVAEMEGWRGMAAARAEAKVEAARVGVASLCAMRQSHPRTPPSPSRGTGFHYR